MALRDAAKMLWERTDLADRRRRRRGLRRLQLHRARLDRGARLLQEGEGGRSSTAGAHRARRRDPDQHERRSALGRALHGYGFLHEACVQLWGEGGARQVPNDPRVAGRRRGRAVRSAVPLLVRD
jgi:hypothetical protein